LNINGQKPLRVLILRDPVDLRIQPLRGW